MYDEKDVWVKKVEKNWCRYGAVVNNQSTFNDCCLDIIYDFVKMRKSAKTERVVFVLVLLCVIVHAVIH